MVVDFQLQCQCHLVVETDLWISHTENILQLLPARMKEKPPTHLPRAAFCADESLRSDIFISSSSLEVLIKILNY